MSESQRKRRVLFNGQWMEGTPLTLQTGQEPWSEYLCSDGSVVRVKTIVTEVTRLDGAFTPEGEPLYTCKTSFVYHATNIPEELCRRPGSNPAPGFPPPTWPPPA